MDNFISDFEVACVKLNRSSVLPDVSQFNPRLQAYIIALHKLDILLEVNNGGVEMKAAAVTSQRKYYPRFRIFPDASRPFGIRLVCCDFVCDGLTSAIGSRFACASRELAIFMGKNCGELYEPLMA